MYGYMYICIYVYMYMYICINVYMYIRIYVYIYLCKNVYMNIGVYIYSDPKVDRIFFWRVRNLCWDYVGCRSIKKRKQ